MSVGVEHKRRLYAEPPTGKAEVAFGGAWAGHAVRRLVQAIGSADLDIDSIIGIDEATSDGYLEFRVPYRSRWRHRVVVSLN